MPFAWPTSLLKSAFRSSSTATWKRTKIPAAWRKKIGQGLGAIKEKLSAEGKHPQASASTSILWIVGRGKRRKGIYGYDPVKDNCHSSYVPPKVLTNFDLERWWIPPTSDFLPFRDPRAPDRGGGRGHLGSGNPGALRALEMAGCPGGLGPHHYGTNQPRYVFSPAPVFHPSQDRAKKAAAFDVSAGCHELHPCPFPWVTNSSEKTRTVR